MRRSYVMACVGLGLLILGNSCTHQKAEDSAVSNVRLFTVKHSNVMSVQNFPGRVIADEEVNLAFKVSGTLMHVYVDEGSSISKGQLIAEIDPRDYQIQLEAVEAEYMQIKAEAERVMSLYADSVSTADAYDKARYGLRQITAKYENARNQLTDTKIYAPFDGYVQKLYFDPPTVIAAGMPVIALVSGSRQEIEINIPASTYMQRQEINSINTSFDFIPGHIVHLSLISITPKANANQLYTARLAIPQELSPQPSPGMSAMVNIAFNDTISGKTRIPSSALFKKENHSCIWVYNKENKIIELRTVTVERLDTKGNAIITQGISTGEQIVITGVHKLTDKQRVQPIVTESETNIGGLL